MDMMAKRIAETTTPVKYAIVNILFLMQFYRNNLKKKLKDQITLSGRIST